MIAHDDLIDRRKNGPMRKHLTQYRVALNQRASRMELEKRPHPLLEVVLVIVLLCGITGALLVMIGAIVSDESVARVALRVTLAASLIIMLMSVLSALRRDDDLFVWRPVSEVDAHLAATEVLAMLPGKSRQRTSELSADEAASAIARVRKYAPPT